MDASLEVLLGQQSGLLTRQQALRALTPSALRHRLRPGGPWRTVLPGVLVAHTGPLSPQQRLRAGLLHGGPRAMLGGGTAARVHRLRAAPQQERVHVLVPHDVHVASVGSVVVHRSHRLPRPVLVRGLPTVPVARAVVDTARSLRVLDDVRALVAEAVQDGRTTLQALAVELDQGHSAGSALPRQVLTEVLHGVRSAPEAVLRRLLLSSRRLPPATWNGRLLLHGRWLADPDACFEEAGLVVEYDSRAWHLRPQQWEETLRRHGCLEAAGLRVLHVTPHQLRDRPHEVLAQVEAAYLAGLRSGPPPGVRLLPARRCA